MAAEVIMPKAGMAMEEGTLVKWLKSEGDRVEKGEAIVEILTDKVNMEVEAEIDGILLKIVAKEGEVLPVFSIIAYIGEEGEDLGELLSQGTNLKALDGDSALTEDKKEDSPTTEEVLRVNKKVRATPAARKLARERGINLSDVKGTGPKDRIQLSDIKDFKGVEEQSKKITPLARNIAKEQGLDIEAVEGSGFRGKVLKRDVEKLLQQEKAAIQQEEYKGKIVPLTGMRRVIGERMAQSFFTAPTFTLNIDVDMTEVKSFREKVKEDILAETGSKATYTDIIIMAASRALKRFSMVNASLVEEGILLHDYVNIALAVGMDEGLLVPVIKDVDKKSLSEIVESSKDIIYRAKNNRLLPDDMEESTFTISNLGMYGITHFNPIINQPNSAILGVNAIIDKIVAVGGQSQVRPMMTLSLTIDHRVIDGAPGAKFLQYLKQLLESPIKLLI